MKKASSADRWKGAVAALTLFALNAYITATLFRVEYLDQMDSIEGVYIGLARYIREHFFDLSWFPLWYGGIPYQYSYPPLLHFLVAGFAAVARLSNARAYHIVAAVFYCLGPVALFWTARRQGASRCGAFLAGFFYSLISPSCLLISEIRRESRDWLEPRRVRLLAIYGDGHTSPRWCWQRSASACFMLRLKESGRKTAWPPLSRSPGLP